MPEQNMPELTYCRNKRLLTARSYQAVFGDTCYKVAHPNLLLLARPNQLSHPRLGLVVAKKHIRHAVNRNRVKRVVRDTFRLVQHQLNSVDVVFLVRPGMDKLSPQEQTELLENTWQRLSRKLQVDSSCVN
ncbi:MAG: ribonuclease P protein component [Porticoccus sp.]|nr:ribonuclease P protein component [Porticoccus sp.]MBQ0808248.1 ribonuclease P protein component [Porticoccus sp.]MDX2349895.1 ribonuclease P protein component [Porticoccus sp.]